MKPKPNQLALLEWMIREQDKDSILIEVIIIYGDELVDLTIPAFLDWVRHHLDRKQVRSLISLLNGAGDNELQHWLLQKGYPFNH